MHLTPSGVVAMCSVGRRLLLLLTMCVQKAEEAEPFSTFEMSDRSSLRQGSSSTGQGVSFLQSAGGHRNAFISHK